MGFSHASAMKSWFCFPDFAGLCIDSKFKEDVSAPLRDIWFFHGMMAKQPPLSVAIQSLALSGWVTIKNSTLLVFRSFRT